jgi:hypothetical protein
MITLPTEFTSGEGGYSQAPGPLKYICIARNKLVAIYQRFFVNGSPKDFETVIIRVIPKGTSIFNAPPSLDDEERYAVSSSWGKGGFSFPNKESAMIKFNELVLKGIAAQDEIDNPTVEAEMIIPVDFFTVGELAAENKIEYPEASIWVKSAIISGLIKFVREERRNAKGKPSKIYSKV